MTARKRAVTSCENREKTLLSAQKQRRNKVVLSLRRLSQNNNLFARLVKLPTGRAASSVRVRSFVPSIASESGNKSA